MSFARIKESFMHLPREIKLIGVGSLVLGLSTLLPWYADLDSYKIGDEFLGVTGPASFVGIVILVMAGLSFTLFGYHLMGRRMPRLPVREGIVHIAAAVESLFLLLVVNSIYFHPKFGVNITLKESRFGMIAAVIGSAILLTGAYLKNKDELITEKGGETGRLEPLISVPEKTEKPVSPISSQAAPSTKGFVFGERKQGFIERMKHQQKVEHLIESKLEAQVGGGHAEVASSTKSEVHREKPAESTGAKSADGNGSYMIRLDL